jgi:hypothetical protein
MSYSLRSPLLAQITNHREGRLNSSAPKKSSGGTSPVPEYRHVHATGIYALRRLKFRYAIELIVEKAERVAPDADAVIRAIRAASMIDSRGQWREPRRVVVYSREPEDNSAGESRSTQSVSNIAATPGSVTASDAPPADPPGLTFSTDGNPPPSVEIEQGVSLKISRRGVRSNSNRQILVRLGSAGND